MRAEDLSLELSSIYTSQERRNPILNEDPVPGLKA